ncbi:hematopoietic SH2 domain-containing protein homolog [Polyodon spathula]|uniref:hematopoietic SH2 domain-containing protein homolog n=1 Tax=Polyodon spathula TaxID=7913 RepID=UPI001B7DF112|nr:hematopoietic SH2 domain-containing protein homolog [Polyodon spathula]XP_041087143.1 hematopoietic SH2 domain-containing protein homolog [Polyodon spathula]XP_041087144.1 hematopoietic SH2 domain-containing protein homolog [Polyodon spathula]
MDNPGMCRKRDAAIKWFTEFQVDCVMRNGAFPEWFHGIITRKDAEDLLQNKAAGCFLIRVSESRIGYTLSYRTVDCCRHFMIDVLRNGQYTIVGEATSYKSLDHLVDFHQRLPIMPYNEILTVPCGQISKDDADYAELLFSKKQPSADSSSIAPVPFPRSLPKPQAAPELRSLRDVPPPLPSRPSLLRSRDRNLKTRDPQPSAGFQDTFPVNRLYPSLSKELSSMNLLNDARISDDKPEPLPWKNLSKRSQSTETIFKEAPPLPPRTFLPPTRAQEPSPAKRPTEIPLTNSTASEREASKASGSGIFFGEQLCKVKNVIKEMEKEFRTQSNTIGLTLKKNSLKKKGGATETRGHSEPFQAKSAESSPDKINDFSSGFQGNSKETKNIYQELPSELETQEAIQTDKTATNSTAAPSVSWSSKGFLNTVGLNPCVKTKDSGKKQPALPLEYHQPPPFAPGYY